MSQSEYYELKALAQRALAAALAAEAKAERAIAALAARNRDALKAAKQ